MIAAMTQQPQPPLKIIWFALVMATLIYVLMAYMTVRNEAGTPFIEALERPPVPLLYGMAAVMFMVAGYIRRVMLKTPPGQRTPVERIRVALVTRWALTESVAIFGLLAAYLARVPELVLPPAALALLGFMMAFPSDSLLESYASGVE